MCTCTCTCTCSASALRRAVALRTGTPAVDAAEDTALARVFGLGTPAFVIILQDFLLVVTTGGSRSITVGTVKTWYYICYATTRFILPLFSLTCPSPIRRPRISHVEGEGVVLRPTQGGRRGQPMALRGCGRLRAPAPLSSCNGRCCCGGAMPRGCLQLGQSRGCARRKAHPGPRGSRGRGRDGHAPS